MKPELLAVLEHNVRTRPDGLLRVRRYEVEESEALSDVDAFVADLLEAGLVADAEAPR